MSLRLFAIILLSVFSPSPATDNPQNVMGTLEVLEYADWQSVLGQHASDGMPREGFRLYLLASRPVWPDAQWPPRPPAVQIRFNSSNATLSLTSAKKGELAKYFKFADEPEKGQSLVAALGVHIAQLLSEESVSRDALALHLAHRSPDGEPQTRVVEGLEDLSADTAAWHVFWNSARGVWKEMGVESLHLQVAVDVVNDWDAYWGCQTGAGLEENKQIARESSRHLETVIANCVAPHETNYLWARLCDMRTDLACRAFVEALGEVFITSIEGLEEPPEAVTELLAISGPVAVTTDTDPPDPGPG